MARGTGVALLLLTGMLAMSAPVAGDGNPGAIDHMDYGPAIAYTVRAEFPKKNIAYKGLAIRLGQQGDTKPEGKQQGETDGRAKLQAAAIIYDTDLMRVAAASVGGHLDISKINYTSYKGSDVARIAGEQLFGTSPVPGWANPATGKFDDPRGYNGPLPKEWLQYHGHYIYGDQVVLSYRVGTCEVMETAEYDAEGRSFIRHIRIEPPKSGDSGALRLLVCDHIGRKPSQGDHQLSWWDNESLRSRLIHARAQGAETELHGDDGRIHVEVKPTGNEPVDLHVVMSVSLALPLESVHSISTKSVTKSLADLRDVTKGGPTRWPDTVATTAKLAKDDAAYVLDHLGVPLENPYNSWMRLVGFDFFEGGEKAAVSTWNGDVWIVDGFAPGRELDKLTWKRFASGLFEPLGIVVKGETVYALGRDRITRLHDRNGDGEADFYESFNSDCLTYPRAITCALVTDSKGNFYYQKNGNRTPDDVPLHGSILRVSADGKTLDTFATGIRSANGLGAGPAPNDGDLIASSDQEGNWTPASRIDLLTGGEFVGYRNHANTKPAPPMDAYRRPLCWLPKDIDNSPGGLAWCGDERFGPLKDHWFATSYGQARLFVVLAEQLKVNVDPSDKWAFNAAPRWQGGVVPFKLNFGTGIHRLRVNPRDGQLYVAGLKGWQTRGAIDGGFYRVRYTGKPLTMPVGLSVTKTGVRLTFATPLDRELAEDVESYAVKRWNYIYSSKYGSPEMSVADPTKKGRDDAKVNRATLSKDGRVVTLEIEGMKPVMQMLIKLDLETVDGELIDHDVVHTVHRLGG